jgi:hypothetical protein
MKIKAQRESGLSILEVCLVLVALALVASLFLGRLNADKGRAPRIACTSNLKQVGLAFRLWANDHGGQYPQASMNPSGTLSFAHSPQVFRHFLAMSNELVTPKVLSCLEDKKRTRAVDFTKFSNANLSYFVCLDANELYPNGLLSGDRNIVGGTLSNGFLRTLTPNSEVAWTNGIHERQGNVGLADGSVQQMTSHHLRKQLATMTNEAIRLAIP